MAAPRVQSPGGAGPRPDFDDSESRRYPAAEMRLPSWGLGPNGGALRFDSRANFFR
jgi:hypothetical protein